MFWQSQMHVPDHNVYIVKVVLGQWYDQLIHKQVAIWFSAHEAHTIIAP